MKIKMELAKPRQIGHCNPRDDIYWIVVFLRRPDQKEIKDTAPIVDDEDEAVPTELEDMDFVEGED
jgi:hypothetical protein